MSNKTAMLQQAAQVPDPDNTDRTLKEKLLGMERTEPEKFLKVLTEFVQELPGYGCGCCH